MGIPRFYGEWLVKQGYIGVLINLVPNYVSSLNIDMNGLIHKCTQTIYSYGDGKNTTRDAYIATVNAKVLESELHQLIMQTIFNLVDMVQPREVLTLAIDGTAPLAKIQQQRQRRYRSALESRSGAFFDSNVITPGTEFMKNLDRFLQVELVKNQYVLPPKIIYSSHLVPGEGEHKIIDLMRSGEIVGEGAHILYGLDADLIMLSLVAPINNIYLMREDIKDIIHIDNLKNALLSQLGNSMAIYDFILMMFLIGNDFLPHMPAMSDMISSLDTMFRVYQTNNIPLTQIVANGLLQIDWNGLSIFFNSLSEFEPTLLERVAGKDVKYPSSILESAITKIQQLGQMPVFQIDMEKYRNGWYQHILSPKGDTSLITQIKSEQNPFEVTIESITTMISNYITGLAWVLSYYCNGMTTINYNYNYQYHYTPIIRDIAIFLESIQSSNSIDDTVGSYRAVPDQEAFNPIHQLIAVLPPKSRNILPIEVQHLQDDTSPIADMFPREIIIDREGTNTEWQGITILPPVEPLRIIEAVSEVIWDPKRANEYQSATNVIITRNIEIEKLLFDKKQTLETIKIQRQSLPSTFQPKQVPQEYLISQYQGRQSSRGRGYQSTQGIEGYRSSRGRGSRGRGYQTNQPSQGRGYQTNQPSQGRGYQTNQPIQEIEGYQTTRGRGYQSNRGRGRGRAYQSSQSIEEYQSTQGMEGYRSSRGRGTQASVKHGSLTPNYPNTVVTIPPYPPLYRLPDVDPLPLSTDDQPVLYSRNGRGGSWTGTRGGLGSGLRQPTQEEFAITATTQQSNIPSQTKQEAWRSKTLLL